MIYRFTRVLFLLLAFTKATAQDVADLRQVSFAPGRTPAETAVLVGRALIGKPYVAHTLDGSPVEQLVVNLTAFDCTTFVETALALALSYHEPGETKSATALDGPFRQQLTRLRYRDGRIDGYASRLHYLSDWLRDNERKGLLQDVTATLGGITVSKPVSYMTGRVWQYPRLTDPLIFRQIAQVEAALSQQPFAFIPKSRIRAVEGKLREGDVVMLTAARPGLDMKHVGFAVWQAGRVHLLHASSDHGRVVLTAQPLSDYVMRNKRLSGIRVARLRVSTPLTAQAR